MTEGELDGQTAIVTGASRGIGADIARRLARAGATVVCAARTLADGENVLEGSLTGTVDSITGQGGRAVAVVANLGNEEDCKRLVSTALDETGRVDILVNNAAVGFFGPFVDSTSSRWVLSWRIMCLATFTLSQLVLPGMLARGSGRLINLTSESAIGPGRGPYPASGTPIGETMYGTHKVAIERFTQGLAEEVYPGGVGVAAVAPSQLVPTPGAVHNAIVTGEDDPRAEPKHYVPAAVELLATMPLDRMTGRVCYSQQLLIEEGLIGHGRGYGVDEDLPVSGFSLR